MESTVMAKFSIGDRVRVNDRAPHDYWRPLWVIVLVSTIVAVDLSGQWTLSLEPGLRRGMASEIVECRVRQSHERIVIKCGQASSEMTGEVKGQKVTFRTPPIMTRGKSSVVTYTGQLDRTATTLIGAWRFVIMSGSEVRDGNFKAEKH
jgi:hypothetical protein